MFETWPQDTIESLGILTVVLGIVILLAFYEVVVRPCLPKKRR